MMWEIMLFTSGILLVIWCLALINIEKDDVKLWNGGLCGKCGDGWQYAGLNQYRRGRIYDCGRGHTIIIISNIDRTGITKYGKKAIRKK